MSSALDWIKQLKNAKGDRLGGKGNRPRYDRAVKELKMKLKGKEDFIRRSEEKNFHRYLLQKGPQAGYEKET